MLELLLLIAIAFELLLAFRWFWSYRYTIVTISSVLNCYVIGLILLQPVNPWWLLGLLIIIFRLIVAGRVLGNRKQSDHLRNVTARSVAMLVSLQLLAWLATMLARYIDWSTVVTVLSLLQFIVSLSILGWIINSLLQTTYHKDSSLAYTDKELPAITVAIPARNETSELEACIDSIVASNYPKLEILVLDDCSQDKTPAIIKQYAHAGVRFIQGATPPNTWLAKNYAYTQLAQEASGSYIVFCGVDVRMSPNFLRALITHIKQKKKRMISVLPIRLGGDFRSSFIQPMRYWWELALPRKFMNRPAVLSTCWTIDRKILESLGGFAAVKRSILPERFFARECVRHDSYSFIRANQGLDLRTTKSPVEQIRTAVRVRYPQLRNRPESILLFILGLQFLLLAPFVFFFAFLGS
ncbi:MAG: glycosyltransferase family 2 protein, partial [Actinobacteria bacterium]|nr:glycosyltransferase family 2 protein [Actinomycetota bacterium]